MRLSTAWRTVGGGKPGLCAGNGWSLSGGSGQSSVKAKLPVSASGKPLEKLPNELSAKVRDFSATKQNMVMGQADSLSLSGRVDVRGICLEIVKLIP